jgi:hypothetical protein
MSEWESLYCPECAYDLRGIPEGRCPECGFGFERAAVRSIAWLHLKARCSIYRRMVLIAGIAALCWLVGEWQWLRGAFVVVLGAALFVIWGGLLRSRELPPRSWLKFALAATLLLPAVIVASMYAFAFHAVALLLLLCAAAMLTHLPSQYLYAERSLPPAETHRLRNWQVAAWVGLLLGAAGQAAAWL